MAFFNKLFGYRWSLHIQNENQLAYVMHCDKIMIILGYIMSYFAKGEMPVKPWSLHLVFNNKQKIKLISEYFNSDGKNITTTLINQISSIDPDYYKTGSRDLVFENSMTKKRLKITGGSLMEQIENLASDKPEEITFFSVMDVVFGKQLDSK